MESNSDPGVALNSGPSGPRRPRSRRPRLITIFALMAGVAALVLWSVSPGGIQVKVVNRTNGPMTRVQVVLGSGRRLDLLPIGPGRSSAVRIRRGEASDIHLVYEQPDGVTNDLVHTGFSPGAYLDCEDKIVLGVMSHMTNGKPMTMRCYVKRRKRYDLAIYLPFAPGAGD